MGSIVSCGRTKSRNIEISRVKEISKSDDWNVYLAIELSKKPDDERRPTVVDFFASWCRPSTFIEPRLNELASTYTDISFIKIDVDKLKNVAKEFKVDAMPTVVVLKQGKEVARTVGAMIEKIEKMIEDMVNAETSKPAAIN